MATKTLIDTDIGEDIDDVLAVAFALRSPEFEVLGITTVDGDTRARARIARKLALVCGKPGVPVAAGYARAMPPTTTRATSCGRRSYRRIRTRPKTTT